jgi:hypothetical protein
MPEVSGKLRLGILLDSYQVPAWAYAMLERIQQSDYAEIALLVINDTPARPKSIVSSLRNNHQHLLYIAYHKLDERLFRPKPDAFADRDLRDFLANVPCLRTLPRRTARSDRFTPEDVGRIKDSGLDVLVRLGFRILRGEILRSAKLGVWSYHHGDNRVNRGGPAGFWEVMEGHPVTGSMLQILNEDLDSGLALSRSYSATDRWSVKRNCNSYYWKSSAMLPRALRDLHRLGPEAFLAEKRQENNYPPLYAHRLYRKPTNRELAPYLVRHLARYVGHRLAHRFAFNQWNLLYDLHDGISSSFWRYQRIVPPKDRFWADPHVVYRDGIYYIFLEEFLYKRRRGRISVLTVDRRSPAGPAGPAGATGSVGAFGSTGATGATGATRPSGPARPLGAPVPVLEPDYHVSYPFVFEWQGQTYMLVESAAVRRIQVFRCEEFPHRWVFDRNLIEGIEAVDATLFEHQGRWWLFANVKEQAGASDCDELFLFHADNPLSGSWTAHRKNPIVSDARRARPAGSLFLHQGAIYRPSQDCSDGYGYGLVLNRVDLLTETDYREEEVLRLGPDWHAKARGLHTLAHQERLTVIDAKYRRSRLF